MSKGKKNKNFLLKIEDILIGWIIARRHQIFRYVIVTILLIVSTSIPYINIVFSRTLVIFLLFFLGLIIFEISARRIIVLGLLLFVPSLFLLLLGELEKAELLVNYIYGIFILGTLKYMKPA